MVISQLDNVIRSLMAQVARATGKDTIVSASTTNIGSVAGQYVTVTGNSAILSLGTVKAGTIKCVYFSGAPTLTHAAQLVLPGGASVAAAAGDTAVFVSEGAGDWRCISYMRAARAPSPYPAWEQLGPEVLLSTNQTSVEWFDLDAIDRVKIEAIFVPAVADALMGVRVGYGAGTAFDGGTNYGRELLAGVGSSALASPDLAQTFMQASGATGNNASSAWACVELDIFQFNKNYAAGFMARSRGLSSVGTPYVADIGGYHGGPALARNRLQILSSSGPIGAGSRFTLFGRKG